MSNKDDTKSGIDSVSNVMPTPTMPAWTGGRPAGLPIYHSGGARARSRLRQLEYDPLDALVKRHKQLEQELEMQEQLRDGKAVRLRQDGKPKAFVFEQYLGVQRELISIAEKLLRYKYGRVPETETPGSNGVKPQMLVRLNAKGDVFEIGNAMEQEPDFEDDE